MSKGGQFNGNETPLFGRRGGPLPALRMLELQAGEYHRLPSWAVAAHVPILRAIRAVQNLQLVTPLYQHSSQKPLLPLLLRNHTLPRHLTSGDIRGPPTQSNAKE